MTIKGWIFYQGENNCGCEKKRQSPGADYRCSQIQLIESWRQIWSTTRDTTPRDAPFGLVTLPPGTGESGGDVLAPFRVNQTGGFGYVPNEILKNVFAAQAYDLGDPWSHYVLPPGTCETPKCCADFSKVNGYGIPDFRKGKMCIAHGFEVDDLDGDWFNTTQHTLYNWGGIHPRGKRRVGQRLAVAAMGVAYKSPQYPTGSPILERCSAKLDSKFLEVYFTMRVNANADSLMVKKSVLPTQELRYCLGLNCNDFITVSPSAFSFHNTTTFKVKVPVRSSAPIVHFQYAYSQDPCIDASYSDFARGLLPALMNNCVVKTRKFSLPLSPFAVRITDGNICTDIGFDSESPDDFGLLLQTSEPNYLYTMKLEILGMMCFLVFCLRGHIQTFFGCKRPRYGRLPEET